MFVQTFITVFSILALALSVFSLPYSTPPLYPRQIFNSTVGARDVIKPRQESNSTVVSRQLLGSGNSGQANQNAGNVGQNAGSDILSSGIINGDYTIDQAIETCGNAQLNCCSKISSLGDTAEIGILGAVFGSGELGVRCTPLDIAIIGIQVPINKICDAKAACCQADTSESGLINLNCVALASLI